MCKFLNTKLLKSVSLLYKQFKTFNITPSSVKRKQRRPPEQGSEKDSRAVQVGFKETSLPQPDPVKFHSYKLSGHIFKLWCLSISSLAVR